MDLMKRFYDPSIGRFMQVDPVTDTQENYSTYQYGWNNPILRSDPNGDCPSCPQGSQNIADDQVLTYLAANVVAAGRNLRSTISGFLQSGMNTPFIVRSEHSVVADVNGQVSIHESQPFVQDKASAIVLGTFDAAAVSLGGGPAGLLVKSGTKSEVLKTSKEVVSQVSRKANGALTEPKLPPKTIIDQDGVQIMHYTKSGDHGPPHLHVKGAGPETRIGQNGKPLKNNPSPSAGQQSVIDQNKSQIRSAVKKIGAWFNYNQQ